VPDSTIALGCKNFTEQYILMHLLAQRIEGATGLSVNLKELGGTMICHTALVRGDIDGYVEYTGTSLLTIFGHETNTDPQAVLEQVQKDYASQHQVTSLPPLGFANSYAIAVRGKDAGDHGWEKVSDLAGKAAGLKGGFTSEFHERADGYPKLKELYGIEFGETVDLDPGAMYDALSRGHVDLICAFTTDARIKKYGLVVLDDDKRLWPPYDAVALLREATLKQHPEIREALEPLLGLLTVETMTALNYEVDIEGKDPAEVAGAFLKKHGLGG